MSQHQFPLPVGDRTTQQDKLLAFSCFEFSVFNLGNGCIGFSLAPLNLGNLNSEPIIIILYVSCLDCCCPSSSSIYQAVRGFSASAKDEVTACLVSFQIYFLFSKLPRKSIEQRVHIHFKMLTPYPAPPVLISNLLAAPRRLTPGRVCIFPPAFLPGEECQRKSGAILNQFRNA